MYAYFASIRNLISFLGQWILQEFLLLRITQNKVVSSVQLQHVLGKSPSGGVCLAVPLSLGNGVILALLAKIFATCKHTNTSNPEVGLGSSASAAIYVELNYKGENTRTKTNTPIQSQ